MKYKLKIKNSELKIEKYRTSHSEQVSIKDEVQGLRGFEHGAYFGVCE